MLLLWAWLVRVQSHAVACTVLICCGALFVALGDGFFTVSANVTVGIIIVSCLDEHSLLLRRC